MNFYTLTFKKKILLSFLLILGSFVVLNILLYFAVKIQSTKTTFITSQKLSKIIHFNLNNTKNKDIIFMGSSRTFYHISTNTFKKNGINIYNFGMPGAQFEDYPAYIDTINKASPKQVIISLSVNRLYSPLRIAAFPTFIDMQYYYDIDKIKFLRMLRQWAINMHLFLQYSEQIFYKIKFIYEKFNYVHKIIKTTDAIESNNKIFADSYSNYSKLVECKVFNINQNSNSLIMLKCINGDGALISGHIKTNQVKKKNLKILNKQSMQYLKKIITNINRENTKLSIILEPILHNPYSYDLNEIKKQFKSINIIDLTNFKLEDNLWSAQIHLNYKGRKKYSKYLSDILKLKN